jgi:hypothetical protein
MTRQTHAAPVRGVTGAFVVTIVIAIVGLIPTTGGGAWRSALRSLHSLDLNRLERAAQSAGYYDGLIDGRTPGRDELTLTLLGKPPGCAQFVDIDAARYRHGEFLQFELKPNVDSLVLGTRFTTNSFGLRDRPCARHKALGTFRIALLGSSIDMGWGVDTEETYENRFEDWLNAQAARLGVERRFEVLNFAMAAYSPLHRLEVLEQKVGAFEPDVVLYSATRLDTRLLQIHIVGLLQDRVDLKHEFLRDALARVGLDSEEALAEVSRASKDAIKARIEPRLRELDELTVGEVAKVCRERGWPLLYALVPRASEEDAPEQRAGDVVRMKSLAERLSLPALDLTAAFDDEDPSAIEIAPWDDHPNARGHTLLFIALGRQMTANPGLYRLILGVEPSGERLETND